MKITKPIKCKREIVRLRWNLRRLDYHELEPRQLLAAIHGHAELANDSHGPNIEIYSRDTQNRQSLQFNQNDSRSQRGSTSPNRILDSNSQSSFSQNRLPTRQTVPALTSSPVPNIGLFQITTPVNSTPQRDPSPIVLSQPDRTSRNNIVTNPTTSALRIDLSQSNDLRMPFQTDDLDARRDEARNETENNNQLASVSPAEFEMLIGEVESDQGDRDSIDEYFSMFESVSPDAKSLSSDLDSDLANPFDALEQEQNSLDGILSELHDFSEIDSRNESPSNHNQNPYSEQKINPVADPSPPNETLVDDHQQSNSELAEVLYGGMVLLGINDESDEPETEELFEFLTHGMQVELPVADVQIEMSVGVVQNFDIGSREQNVSVGDAAAATAPPTE